MSDENFDAFAGAALAEGEMPISAGGPPLRAILPKHTSPESGVAPARTPKEVIDEAIRENTKLSWLGLVMALSFSLTAIGSLVWGVWSNQAWPIIGGAAATAGAWGVVHLLLALRKANMALRLVELSLSDPRTAGAALADLLAVYREQIGKGSGGRKNFSLPATEEGA
jgi:hypothetical protein